MDLGIAGRSAIVCASSRGLGKACALALVKEGVDVWICARNEIGLEEAQKELAAAGAGDVHAVVADVTTEEGRDAMLNACAAPDILVNNAGGPPPGDFRNWRQSDWFDAINANMYSAIDLIRRTLDGMIERQFGRVVNITSSSVKAPIAELGLSNGARAGLTGFVSGIARAPAKHNVTINNLLPGYFGTARLEGLFAAKADAAGLALEEYKAEISSSIPAGRTGDPDEFGAVCAFLCSEQAAYITAQNILVDGGRYSGTY
jgi:3-oxoacyl-[acyl-carrier protein] reductase